MGSTRFPGKVMQPVAGRPLIELLLSRLARSRRINKIVLATSMDAANDGMARHVQALGFDVFRGSEHDVLDRYYRAAEPYAPHAVVRVTGDCPLIDPALVDKVIDVFEQEGVDYASNIDPPNFPDGLDTEVFTLTALKRAWSEATRPEEREHVTPYISRTGKFTKASVTGEVDCSAERWTVDEPADFEVVRAVFEHFGLRRDFTWEQVYELRRSTLR